MSLEDVFTGARMGCLLYGAYLNTVAQEIGMEKALALNTRMCEAMGAQQGHMMREQSGISEFNAKTAFPFLRNVPESLGIAVKIVEETPQRVVSRSGKCSFYEAAQMLGAGPQEIAALCQGGCAALMSAATKALSPGLNYQPAKYRKTQDDYCEHHFVMA